VAAPPPLAMRHRRVLVRRIRRGPGRAGETGTRLANPVPWPSGSHRSTRRRPRCGTGQPLPRRAGRPSRRVARGLRGEIVRHHHVRPFGRTRRPCGVSDTVLVQPCTPSANRPGYASQAVERHHGQCPDRSWHRSRARPSPLGRARGHAWEGCS
jgi:hypothetical protein